MRAAGNDIKNKAGRLINAEQRRRSAIWQPSRVGARLAAGAPLRRDLRSSLKTFVFKSGEGFAVRARQFYALFLEAGAKGGGNPGASRGSAGQPADRPAYARKRCLHQRASSSRVRSSIGS